MGYGHANTVEGMQLGVHEVIANRCRPLDKQFEGYRYHLIFDTRAAGCLECDNMVRTHPTKSVTAHYCLDDKCWDRHQEEQQEKISAEAKAKMEQDILRRATTEAAISRKIPPEVEAQPAAKGKKKAIPVVAEESGIALPVPCTSCAKADSCDRSYFHIAFDSSDRLVCEQWVKPPKEILTIIPDVPEDILSLAREKAGTRAEVLDLRELGANYYQDIGQGYALLDSHDHALEHIIDPEECLERCTHGFHFAFDSRQSEPRTRYVCSDTKCLAKKKAAFTRAKNAEGQARKKAETKAVKEAVAQTTILDRPRIKLILLAQMDGLHASRTYYYGTEGQVKKPEKWLWDKVSAGTPENDRTRGKLFKAIDKLPDEELAKLVVEFMFYFLTDKGDIGTYEIKAAEPLKWMAIDIKIDSEGDKDHE
ncbi:hypothetical protein ES703_47661 [subsurface metagenome]